MIVKKSKKGKKLCIVNSIELGDIPLKLNINETKIFSEFLDSFSAIYKKEDNVIYYYITI